MKSAGALMPSGKAARWWLFTHERFEPLSHLLMVALFFLAHLAVVNRVAGGVEGSRAIPVFLFLGSLAFFFKLRLYDEIKDYEVDLLINPTRPLARGLLKHRDLYLGIGWCIAAEVVTFALAGSAGVMSVSVAIGYSLLMYKEFFVGELLRPHLTTYALTHTIVSSFLSLAVFAALTGTPAWDLPFAYYAYALANWGLFNIFEFGRKTFATTEERPGVASYSNIFGRSGAVALVVAMALASNLALSRVSGFGDAGAIVVWSTFSALLLVGVVYIAKNKPAVANIWRGFSSIYIILVYAEVVVLWAGGLH